MALPDFQTELDELARQGLLRSRRLLEQAQRPHARIDGGNYLAFCSNDYLGFAADQRLARAMADGAQRYGVGAGASHLVNGHTQAHEALERALAVFAGAEAALVFSSGYMANLGVVAALAGRGDAIFCDRLNHASLVDAALLSRCEMKRYPHGDLAALERMLAASAARRRLVVTDAVFSMDGDVAPLPRILELCERYDAALYVDDAHGFGVLGREGRGTLSHFGIASPRIIYMATLGKAAGVAGAFVAGTQAFVSWLVNRARTYIYTTAMPPPMAHALCASLVLLRDEEWRRERLRDLVVALKTGLAATRWRLMPSDTAIQPIVVGTNDEALRLSSALASRGILVPAIRPPTVPRGTARLRITLSAAHDLQDVGRLVAALAELQ